MVIEQPVSVTTTPGLSPFVPPRENPAGRDVERELVLASVEQGLLGDAAPVKIGRFVIARQLGRGAMGVVYLAYDPTLDREVAIKVVDLAQLGSEIGDAQARLEREAQAAATLRHTNVVGVYDVGEHNGQVFLAMEYVRGQVLREWVDRGARTWREVLELFVPIAAGLAAAHAAGIVHRDFKPDNVLIDEQGQPRIVDFGLARPVEGWQEHEQALRRADGDELHAALMATTGGVCGTPAYMAPEQFIGVDVGPASEQFAFCVALYEALFDARPFVGERVTDLAQRVIEGRREPAPKGHSIPRKLLDVLERGLDRDPNKRFASMQELGNRLRSIVGRRQKVRIGAAAAVVVLGSLAGGYAVARDMPQPCEDSTARLEAVWGGQARERVLPMLQPEVVTLIDNYANAWAQSRYETCAATHIRFEQSAQVMQLRTACLDRGMHRLAGLTSSLEVGGERRLSAPAAESLLPALDDCADVELLKGRRERYSHEGLRGDAEQIDAWMRGERLIAEARASRLLGGAGWLDKGQRVLELGRTHGLPALEAAGLALAADDLQARGKLDAAQQAYAEAVELALQSRFDEEAVDVAIPAAAVALARGNPATARVHLRYAQGLAHREFRPLRRAELKWRLEALRGRIEVGSGNNALAVEALERARTLMSDQAADYPAEAARVAQVLGVAYRRSGRVGRARLLWLEALERFENLGDGGRALELAGLRNNLGVIALTTGEYNRAATHFEAAAHLCASAQGTNDVLLAQIIGNQGRVELRRDHLEQAKALQLRSIRMREQELGADHPSLAYPYDELGKNAYLRGDLTQASEHLSLALRLRLDAYGAQDHRLAETLTTLGEVLAAQGHRRRALERLTRALQLLGREGADPLHLANAQLAHAKVLATPT